MPGLRGAFMFAPGWQNVLGPYVVMHVSFDLDFTFVPALGFFWQFL